MTSGSRRAATAGVTLPLLLLSGCLFTTRKLPVPRGPGVVQTASADELVAKINQRWNEFQTLDATVEIQASVTNSKEGVARDYTTIRGIILMRKPEMVRVLGRVPVLGTPMFDMASDGNTFTLRIPSKDLAYKGLNKSTHKSTNTIENMRPDLFFDAMEIRGIGPEDEYTRIADSDTVMDPSKKHLLIIPEYILSLMHRKGTSHELQLVRVIHFRRQDLLPYQQDIYNDQNQLETQVIYGPYADFGKNQYPTTVTIKRPLDQYQVVLTLEKVTENMPLSDDQFEIKIPEGTKIKNLD